MATITIAIHFAAIAYFTIGFAVSLLFWWAEWRRRAAETDQPRWDANDLIIVMATAVLWPVVVWIVASLRVEQAAQQVKKRQAKRMAETSVRHRNAKE